MTQNIPAIIMGFREGLEAFLVIALILRYLTTIGKTQLKGKVPAGHFLGGFPVSPSVVKSNDRALLHLQLLTS